jgi:hypothetical protein
MTAALRTAYKLGCRALEKSLIIETKQLSIIISTPDLYSVHTHFKFCLGIHYADLEFYIGLCREML